MTDQKKPRIYLSPPHMSGEEKDYIDAAFTENWISPVGPNVDAFEHEISTKLGLKGAVALSSGTAGIHLALQLLGIKEGDIVFCSTFTFVASVNPVLYQGATPVFIDSDWTTWNMSPSALELAFNEAVEKKQIPKAVIVVHLYGLTADMAAISSICQRYGVPVIEDAAEALGAEYHGIPAGTIGNYGVFSFNGNKIITTSGGGMLVSNDVSGLERAKMLASQARVPALHYEHMELGYNYRLSNVLAGIGRAQLKVLDDRVRRKRQIFEKYVKELNGTGLVKFMPEPAGYFHSRWLSTCILDTVQLATSIIDSLSRENIESRPLWKPMHMQPLFIGTDFFTADGDVAAELFQRGLCLPSGTAMTDADIERIILIILKQLETR